MTLPPQADAVGAHTPGPWTVQISPVRRTLCVMSADTWICGEFDNPNTPLEGEEAQANARLIAEAGTVATETGLTPRQIAERHADLTKQRDELVAALKLAVFHIEHMAAWIGKLNSGYSFESLGEDMPCILSRIGAGTP